MATSVTCARCGQALVVEPETAGPTVTCSACGAPVAVPAAGGGYEGPAAPRRSGSKMPLILAGVAGVAVLVVVVVLLGKTLLGGGISKAVRYLPDDCEAIFSVDLAGIMKSKLYQKLEKDHAAEVKKAFEDLEKDLGLKPTDVVRITVGGNMSDNAPVAVIELSKAVESKDVLNRALAKAQPFGDEKKLEAKEEQCGGVTLYVIPRSFREEGLHFPDKKTIVFGTPKTLRTVLERKGPPPSSSKTHALVGQLKPSRAVTGAIAVPDKLKDELPPIPLPGLAESLKSLSSVAFHADVAADVRLAASVTFKEEEPAKKAQEALDKGKAEMEKAEGAPQELRDLVKGLKVSRSGKTVNAEVTIAEALIDKAIKNPDMLKMLR